MNLSRKDAEDAKRDMGFRILDTGFRNGWSRRWGSRKDAKEAKRDMGFRILDAGFRSGWSRRWGSRKDAKDTKRPTYRIDNKKIGKETAS